MNEQWYKITHWGRFTDVKIEEVEVTRETAQMVFFNETWAGKVRESRARKQSEDSTFIQGKEDAFSAAISFADSNLARAESLARTARKNIKALQDQEKS